MDLSNVDSGDLLDLRVSPLLEIRRENNVVVRVVVVGRGRWVLVGIGRIVRVPIGSVEGRAKRKRKKASQYFYG